MRENTTEGRSSGKELSSKAIKLKSVGEIGGVVGQGARDSLELRGKEGLPWGEQGECSPVRAQLAGWLCEVASAPGKSPKESEGAMGRKANKENLKVEAREQSRRVRKNSAIKV